MLGGMGADLGDAPLRTPLADLQVEGGRGVLQAVIDSVPGGRPTIEDMVGPELRRRGLPFTTVRERRSWPRRSSRRG
jgi:long-chain alkane monooxygenase